MECASMAYAKIKVSSLPDTAYVAPPKPRPANRKVQRPITSSFARRRPPVQAAEDQAAHDQAAEKAAEPAETAKEAEAV